MQGLLREKSRTSPPALLLVWALATVAVVIFHADRRAPRRRRPSWRVVNVWSSLHVEPGLLVHGLAVRALRGGIDTSSAFIEMAVEALAGEPRVSFAVGDAAATGQADAFFDLVIAHTVYSHLVDPERALVEARRVLKAGGQLVIFDGDFATITVALLDGDPLQAAVGQVLRHSMHAPYIMRLSGRNVRRRRPRWHPSHRTGRPPRRKRSQ